MTKNTDETYCPEDRMDWRRWLEENHQARQSIWLVCYKASSGRQNLTWGEAVDEALCFGWIDSLRKSLDKERFIQFFTKRKPKSTWSKINKEKVQQLIAENRMTEAGIATIAVARQNGYWNILDPVEQLIIPEDLDKALCGTPGASIFFQKLSKSNKKAILHWIVFAKRVETREKRIAEVAELAGKGMVPEQFR